MKKYIKIKEPDMRLVKIRKNYQITLPRDMRSKFNLAEGDYVEAETKDGFIVLRPVKLIQPDQEYFYTREWQEKEAEVDQEIRRGDIVGPFHSAKEAIETLRNSEK